MIKKLLSLALAAIFTISFCSCGDKTLTGKSFAYSVEKDPECLDPQIADNEVAFTVLENCMEGLVRLDIEGNIVPGVAESWDVSSDGLTYTFHLRKNAKWHVTSSIEEILPEDFDNTVTADDFIFAFQRALSPVTKSPYAELLYPILNAVQIHQNGISAENLGVAKDDDFTFIITLSEPKPEFLKTLTSPVSLPCNIEFFEATGGRYGLSAGMLMCNGGFYLNRWLEDDYLSMRFNEDYSGEYEITPSSLTLYVEEKSAQIDRFNSKESDALEIPGKMLQDVSDSDKKSLSAYSPSTYSILFNQKCDILTNFDVRAALVKSVKIYDINRPNYLEYIKGLIPGSEIIFDKNYSDIRQTSYKGAFDSDAARSHLHSLEQDDISSLGNLTMICPEDEELRFIASYVIQYWQKYLGIYISLETLSDDRLEQKVLAGDYDIAFYPISFGNDELVTHMRYSITSVISLSDAGYDGIFAPYDGDNTEQSAVLQILASAENYLTDNFYIFPMYYSQRYFILADGCDGIWYNSEHEIVNFMYALKED